MDIRDKVFLRLQALEDQAAAAGRDYHHAMLKGDDEAAEQARQVRLTSIDEWSRVIHTVQIEPGDISSPLITSEDYANTPQETVDAMLEFAKDLGLPLRHDVGGNSICAMVKHKLDELALKILTIEHFAAQMGEQGPVDDDPYDLGLGDLEF